MQDLSRGIEVASRPARARQASQIASDTPDLVLSAWEAEENHSAHIGYQVGLDTTQPPGKSNCVRKSWRVRTHPEPVDVYKVTPFVERMALANGSEEVAISTIVVINMIFFFSMCIPLNPFEAGEKFPSGSNSPTASRSIS